MATPAWQPGTLYAPGALVVPRSLPPPGPVQVQNGGFDANADEWELDEHDVVATLAWQATGGYQSPGCIRFDCTGNPLPTGEATIRTDDFYPVVPGQSITARGYGSILSNPGGQGGFRMFVEWYGPTQNYLSSTPGTAVNTSGTGYRISTVTAQAPAGASYAKPAMSMNGSSVAGTVSILFDNFTWDYISPVPSGLQYRAVQPAIGTSDTVEPTWPLTLGQTVVDNEVIWEAVALTRIVWQARSILRSGAVEPTWPTQSGAFVADNTISWQAISRRVEDPKCPQSKFVVIAASKVFAGDRDIIAYSATVNPLDWSTQDNAGYLPFGLQLYGANPVAALGLYRGNVVAFNVQGGQVWQVDEDPALMQLLDAFPIGSQHHHATAPVTNDLFILTQLGVRTLGIAAGATNLQAGDVGMPVDPMVQEALRIATGQGVDPVGLYNPNAGQYWLMFRNQPDAGQTLVFVHTMNRLGRIGAWTRYVFPFEIDDWSIKGESLFIRHDNIVSRLTTERESDEMIDTSGAMTVQPFEWTIQWPWLDFGAMGVTKLLQGFDIIGTGAARISFGYDQANGGIWTPAWELIADSVPGQLLPMPLSAPSLAVRLTYTGNDVNRTGWDAINLHFTNFRTTA